METNEKNIPILETDFNLDENMPLNDYPRPQFKRDSFLNLNGIWRFKEINEDGINSFIKNNDLVFEEILVPYPMESKLSKINRRKKDKSLLAYLNRFSLPTGFLKKKTFIHFGAIDQIATIYLNKQKLTTHEGGYYPFKVDVTDYLKDDNELVVIVKDNLDTTYPTGKQKNNNGGIWYTPVSGIWQTVWMESVDDIYLDSIKLDPIVDTKTLSIKFNVSSSNITKEIKVSYLGKLIKELKTNLDDITISFEEIKLWRPEEPNLYDLEIKLISNDCICDHVTSYFAFRKLSYGLINGKMRLLLNDKPYFFHGLLDQGWYPDGLYTVKSNEVYLYELTKLKELGFNTLRKHIKIEPLYWYYLCDKLGIVVFQDMVNVGEYSFIQDSVLPILGKRDTKILAKKVEEKAKENFLKYLKETVELLYNSPSVCYWTIFNEGWGEFNPKEVNELLHSLDNTRFIDSASGWFYKEDENDLESHHIYFTKIDINKKPLNKINMMKKALVISEFGGYIYKVDGHVYDPKREFGYKKISTLDEYNEGVYNLYHNEIIPLIDQGLSGAIYTQVSDVEEELNGLFTYDRKVLKLSKDVAIKIKGEIDEHCK